MTGLSPLLRRTEAYMGAEGILDRLGGGVLLAFSGGADSVLLAHLLARLSAERGFRLCALHVHHHLRGEEADRDAAFCARLAEELGIPFRIEHVDVRAEASASHRGIEETARRLRYRALRAELAAQGLGVIATAHHATDHLETVLHRMLRGGGARALLGIRPMRGDLVRPLLFLKKEEILSTLSEEGISYVTDATNADVTYTRNYLRAEVLPLLSHVVPSPEEAVLRMSEALSHDVALLDRLAEEALLSAPRTEHGVSADHLRALPEALRRRVLVRLYEDARDPDAADVALGHTHLVALSQLLLSGKPAFSLAVPNRLTARLSRGGFSFRRVASSAPSGKTWPIVEGENRLSADFVLTVNRRDGKIFARCSSKLYRIDTTAAISSAIINGELFARVRLAGDAYSFGGHTHTLKKLYNEKALPPEVRPHLPLLCDGDGILWMPLCPVREKRRAEAE